MTRTRPKCSGLLATLTLPSRLAVCFAALATLASAQVGTVYGLKSCGSSPPLCGTVASAVPTHLYSFTPGSGGVSDHGPVTHNGVNVIVDAMAQSALHGLLVFELTADANGVVLSSRLASISPATASISPIGPPLARDIRGATFDRFGRLYVLDAVANSLLRVDPTNGSILLGSEVPLVLAGGGPITLTSFCDLALRTDGRMYLASVAQILELDLESGDATLVRSAGPLGFAGACFAPGAAQDALFAFDVTGTDDIVRFDLDAPSIPMTVVHPDVLSSFNAGRGDLATLFPQVPRTYCTSGVTTNGCQATLSANVNPNVAHSSGCVVSAADVEGQKSGLVFYSLSGANNAPWCAGGTSVLCVKSPTQRMIVQNSGGTANTCNGALVQDWDLFQSSNPLALGQPWNAGKTARAQAWFRDPPSCKTTSLSNAVELTYQP
jgi:hypothetical protein